MTPDQADRLVQSGAYRDSLERINELRRALKDRFARKDDVVDALCAASVAQIPTVLIGPPGTAKSNIVRCFCEGLGLSSQQIEGNGHASAGRRYFEYLLTRYTTPEEIFGPIHVQDLVSNQIYRRVTTGYLPEAQIAFLDEIFKASSAIVNTLLTILNERIFYNGGVAMRVPMIMAFAASNEAPSDETLHALYDRFPLRIHCPSVENEHIPDLLSLSWQQAFDRQFNAQGLAVQKVACPNDLRVLRHAMRVKFGGRMASPKGGLAGFEFSQEFLGFFRSLRSEYAISDRTLSLLLAFCRASCLLDRRDEMGADELNVFKYVAWDQTGELHRTVDNMKRRIRV
jgi:MoxR-like ATPase